MKLTLKVTRHAGHAGATLKRRGSIPRLGSVNTRRWSNLGLIVAPGPCRSCRRLRSFKSKIKISQPAAAPTGESGHPEN
ncbi:hypothetical protein C9422_14145 [Pseudomonas sp. B1(2018)]|nr:hypothetical protein C9422_14145 [Pseudomonas sp. B1(2018)]